MDFEFDFFPLFIVLAVAWLSPIITDKLRFITIPSVIIEIIAGFIIGKHGLNILPDAEYMEFLGLCGFVFLMYLSGFEVDVQKIISSLPRRKITYSRFMANPLLVGLILYLGTLILANLGAWIISQMVEIQNLWYFSLIISTTSVGVIMPVLKDRGEINKRFGQMLVLAAAVADILSILLFTLTTTLIKKGFEAEVLLLLSLFIAFYFSYVAGKRLIKNRYLKRILFQLSHAASQIKVRGTIALILLFIILSQLIDAEVILGAFMAGVLMSIFTTKERSSLIMKLDGIGYGFFIPIFFILVGANIDLDVIRNFDDSFLFLGVLLLILFAIKVIPSLIWSRLFGLKRALAGGFLISSRLSLIIAAAQVGLQLGVITPETNTAFVILAVITCIFSPIIYNQLNKKSYIPDDKTIIVGGTYAGELLARNLKLHEKQVVIIEPDQSKVEKLRGEGFEVIHGNGADINLYHYLKLQPENHIILLTRSDDKNLAIARILRNELHHDNVISYASNPANLNTYKDLEVDVIYSSQTIANSIENLIFRPATYHTIFESFEEYNVEEIPVKNHSLEGQQLKDIQLHKDGFLILIKREGEMRVPHGHDYLMEDDVAVVFGTDTALLDYRRKLALNWG